MKKMLVTVAILSITVLWASAGSNNTNTSPLKPPQMSGVGVTAMPGGALSEFELSSGKGIHPHDVSTTDPSVIIYIGAELLAFPNPNSLAYTNGASNIVWQLYDKGFTGTGLGRQLETAYITQPAGDYRSNSLWFTCMFESKSVLLKYSPTRLVFIVTSTDGLLNETVVFTNQFYSYWDGARGFNWVSDSEHRQGNQRASGYLRLTDDNEYITVGVGCPFYTWDESYSYAQVDAYIHSFPYDFAVKGTWLLLDGSSNVIAKAVKTLHTHVRPLQGVLTITRTNNVSASVGLNGGGDEDSYILQEFDPVGSSGLPHSIYPWRDVATMNGDDRFTRVITATNMTGFWRQDPRRYPQ